MTEAFAHGDTIAIAIADGVGAVLVSDAGVTAELDETTMVAALVGIEQTISPRWVWWSADTARALVAVGLRPARCWDLDAVHRLLVGGWRSGAGRIWAHQRGLDTAGLPQVAAPDLFSQPVDDDHAAVRPDGHLDPAWIDGLWKADLDHLRTWASLALDVHRRQVDELERLPDPGSTEHRTVGIGSSAAVCRARGRRPPHRHRRGRTDHRIVHRPATDRRGGRGTASRPNATSSCCAISRVRSATSISATLPA